jgi:hypothetical protein
MSANEKAKSMTGSIESVLSEMCRLTGQRCMLTSSVEQVGGTCAARSHRVRRFAPCASPFPPSTPQVMLSAGYVHGNMLEEQ